jgi:hypothetical protein
MIHIALVIVAMAVIFGALRAAFEFVAPAFDDDLGYGCLSVVAVVILAINCTRKSQII